MKAIQVNELGGPEQMQLQDVPDPTPAANEALIEIKVSGVNFIDVYFRKGLYKAPLPMIPGSEASGIVRAVGGEVNNVKPGDRVAYAMARGSYAELQAVPANLLVKLPDHVTFEQAAAAMLQGMTAHYLTHATFPVQAGQTVLVHAAAGGAGALIVQMAKMLGARVFGTAGSPEKLDIARAAGCDEVINYRTQDFEAEVKRLTDGTGVHAIYDSVGESTFLKGLNVIRPRGMMVLFGQSSGPVAPIDPNILNPKGSLFLTRPSLGHYTATTEELDRLAGDVLNWIAAGKLHLRIDHTYPLADAAQAHRDLESRKTAGKLLLAV
ncbi:quinone oxidoreductase family protein [Nevskia soli]|uniref:quinone oxidoreductase family protein n=1 Tax=Nevskia soli TaxID=418856 RepID=UPI0015D799F7|nr:quinone oxidoreductase [Nevskia soli]